jgi:hypothetical protein
MILVWIAVAIVVFLLVATIVSPQPWHSQDDEKKARKR